MKILLSIIILTFSISASALEVPHLNGFINDYTSIITPIDKVSIENKIINLEKNNSTQIIILTIPTLDNEVLEDFSLKVADKWVKNQKKIYDGILILVVKNDRKIRIEISRGLEAKLTDTILKRIINENIIPKFKEDDFSGGIAAGVDAIISIIKGEVVGDKSLNNDIPLKIFLKIEHEINLPNPEIDKPKVERVTKKYGYTYQQYKDMAEKIEKDATLKEQLGEILLNDEK